MLRRPSPLFGIFCKKQSATVGPCSISSAIQIATRSIQCGKKCSDCQDRPPESRGATGSRGEGLDGRQAQEGP